MKRACVMFLLGVGWLAAQTITFSGPTLTPTKLPACAGTPGPVTQTATYDWTTWCGSISIQGGEISGTGTGYCSGLGGYCAISLGGPIAPVFSTGAPVNPAGTAYLAYVQNQSITSGSAGMVGQGYGCGVTNTTQSANVSVSVPKCSGGTGHCQVAGAGEPDNCQPSPIVIDPLGEGFHLTDAQHGVMFSERPGSPKVQLGWTDPAYHNGWLVRPNPDGSVTNLATNLFGNLSPQPPSKSPNGYRALAYWALQSGCGEVDHLDAQDCSSVWSQLRLWTDSNQDGIAQPEELHTLDSLGVERISLQYHDTRRMDQYGNLFRYVAGIEDSAGKKDNRCYDVFLVSQ